MIRKLFTFAMILKDSISLSLITLHTYESIIKSIKVLANQIPLVSSSSQSVGFNFLDSRFMYIGQSYTIRIRTVADKKSFAVCNLNVIHYSYMASLVKFVEIINGSLKLFGVILLVRNNLHPVFARANLSRTLSTHIYYFV